MHVLVLTLIATRVVSLPSFMWYEKESFFISAKLGSQIKRFCSTSFSAPCFSLWNTSWRSSWWPQGSCVDRYLGPDPILGLSVKGAGWVCLASGGEAWGSAAFPVTASLLSKPVSTLQIGRRPVLALMRGSHSRGVYVCAYAHTYVCTFMMELCRMC